MNKRRFLSSMAVLAASLSLSVPANAAPDLVVGRDYALIEPAQPTENSGKIEVLEFFSYGCPHCAEFEPAVSKWRAKLPADVTFKRVPVSFNRAAWANLGKLYYALEATGDIEKLDGLVFEALHHKNAKLFDDSSIIEWVRQQGADAKKFGDTYKSFGVVSQMKRAEQMAPAYKIQGVPALAVDGKYLVLGKEVKSFDELLGLADRLIDRARAEKAKKK